MQVARETDTCDHGLAFLVGSDVVESIKVNGLSIAVHQGFEKGTTGPCGLFVSNPDSHPQGATNMGVAEGSNNVFAAGFPVHAVENLRGCGARTITGSPDVLIN